MARPKETYRAARRNIAKALHLPWSPQFYFRPVDKREKAAVANAARVEFAKNVEKIVNEIPIVPAEVVASPVPPPEEGPARPPSGVPVIKRRL